MDLSKLTVATLPTLAATVRTTHVPFLTLAHGLSPIDALVLSGARPSRGSARRLIEQGGLRVNEVGWTDPQQAITLEDAILGLVIVLRVGKRHVFLLVADLADVADVTEGLSG